MTTHDERLGRALRELDVPYHGPDFYSRLAERLDQEPTHRRPGRHRPRWIRPQMLLSLGAIAAAVVAVVAMSSMFRGDRPDVQVEAGGGTIPATTAAPTPTSLPSTDPTTVAAPVPTTTAGPPAPPTTVMPTPLTTVPATGQTTTTFPKAITVGAITFHVPLSWGVIGGGDAAEPRIAFVGLLAGGAGDITLRVQTGFTGTVDSLVPKTCLGFPPEAPARVELVESGFKPIGDRTAEFRFWRAACPNGDGDKLEEHRAWLLPDSQIAIFEQRHAPEAETVVATAHVA